MSRTFVSEPAVYMGVVVGWTLIAIGLALEALNLLIYHPRGMSSIVLVPPLAVALGMTVLPGVTLGVRLGVVAAAFLFNLRLLTPWFSFRQKRRP